MNAKEAYDKSLVNKIKLAAQDSKVREALEAVEKATILGNFSCEYFWDEKVKAQLELMGYKVSGKWVNKRWGGDYMTINWDK